jgi:hypothetical protein
VDDRPVAGAVIGEHPFDADPVASEEGDRPVQEAGRGRAFLVGEHFDVGEAAVVVDGDLDVLPADRAADLAVAVGEGAVGVPGAAADAPTGAADDPAELLHVEVDELARP